MASEVELCNVALRRLGDARRITSLDDGSSEAEACRTLYPVIRDRVLRGHTWNFSTRRVLLAEDAVEPISEFENAFVLPNDFIRIRQVQTTEDGNFGDQYRLEGRRILTDYDEVWLVYQSIVTDVTLFPPDLYDALAYLLASDLAIDINQSRGLSERWEIKGDRILRKARATDGLDDFSDRFPTSSWVTIRRAGVDQTGFIGDF